MLYRKILKYNIKYYIYTEDCKCYIKNWQMFYNNIIYIYPFFTILTNIIC